MGIAEHTRALAPSCGHVLRRRKHPGADPASHAGRTARTALSHRDASRVKPPWSGEGSVRPLAVANDVGPVEAIRRTQPAATLAAKLGRGLPAVRIPPTAQPLGDQAGQGGGGRRASPLTGVLAELRPLQRGAWRAAVRPDVRGRWATLRTYHYFGYDRAGGHEPGLSGAR